MVYIIHDCHCDTCPGTTGRKLGEPMVFGGAICNCACHIKKAKQPATTACMQCYFIGTDEEVKKHKCLGVAGRTMRPYLPGSVNLDLKRHLVHMGILVARMRGCHAETGKHELMSEAESFLQEFTDAVENQQKKGHL